MTKKRDIKKILRDLFEGRRLRDEGMDTVLEDEKTWMVDVFTKVYLKLPSGWRGIGEDIRIAASRASTMQPHHYNCWGGFINTLIRQGYLTKVPLPPINAQVPSAHARLSQILEKP